VSVNRFVTVVDTALAERDMVATIVADLR